MSALTLYTAMTSLEADSYRQELTSANLANVDTPGFRAQIGTLLSTPFSGPAADNGQADVVTEDAGVSRTLGPIRQTGNPWDVALNGQGWLTVRTKSGAIALTRDGQLRQGPNGLLEDSQGDPVLGAGLHPISLPKLTKLTVAADGTISGVPAGQGTQQAQQFNRLFIAQTPPGPLTRIGGSRFALPGGVARPSRAAGVQVKQGYLEGSDVNAVTAMTALIEDTRSFQIGARLVQGDEHASQGLDSLISQG